MRTTEERIKELHSRAGRLERQRIWRILAGSGGMSVLLAVFLAFLILKTDKMAHAVSGSRFAGSSLLSDSIGGYVIVALGAFFIGVMITAILIRSGKK